MMRLIAATTNKGKLKEIREIFGSLPFEIVSMTEAGYTGDIEETGSTFEENAILKAKAIADFSGETAMADDSGLEVDYLGGQPGIYSARFAGEGASDDVKNQKLLGLLQGVPPDRRTARFVCAIALVTPQGSGFTVRGTCEGVIASEPKGINGFGYDPLFYIPEFGMTVAEMPSTEKNSISHRGRALRLMLKEFEQRHSLPQTLFRL